MRKLILVFILLMPTLTFGESLLFGDSKNGGKLHSKSCTACHDSKMYTRENRKTRSINGLEARVAMCSANLNTNYTDDQNGDIVKFLNKKYYKFQ